MDEKLNELKDCHKRWQDISINQFGYVNNWFISIGIAFITFAFDKASLSKISFSEYSEFDWNIATLILVVISIVYGLISALSRLYDFRLTRHITLTKQRFYESNEDNLENYEFSKPSFCEKIEALEFILFKDLLFLSRSESKNILKQIELEERMKTLRKTSNALGIITWDCLRMEIIFLALSIICYTIYLLN